MNDKEQLNQIYKYLKKNGFFVISAMDKQILQERSTIYDILLNNKYIDLNEKNHILLHFFGLTCTLKKDFETAIMYYQRASILGNVFSTYNTMISHYKRLNYSLMYEYCKIVIDSKVHLPIPIIMLGETMNCMGKYYESKATNCMGKYYESKTNFNLAIKYYLLGIQYKCGVSAYNLGYLYDSQISKYNSNLNLAIKYLVIAVNFNVDVLYMLYRYYARAPIKIYTIFLTIKKTNNVRKIIKKLKKLKEVKNNIMTRNKCYTNKQKYTSLNYDVNKRFINYLGSNKLA